MILIVEEFVATESRSVSWIKAFCLVDVLQTDYHYLLVAVDRWLPDF